MYHTLNLYAQILITFRAARLYMYHSYMYLHYAHVRVEAGEYDLPPPCKAIDIIQNGVSTQVHIETGVIFNNISSFILLW